MNSKPVIFISHMSEENEIALALKKLLLNHLDDTVSVYISSDQESIEVGDRWLDSVLENLMKCTTLIIMCSPTSMKRTWIPFEAGVGWSRNIRVIPVCYGGMTVSQLKNPLAMMQAVNANNTEGMSKLLNAISKSTNSSIIKVINCENFTKLVEDFRINENNAPIYYETSADFQIDLPSLMQKADKSLVFSGIHFIISLGNRFQHYLDVVLSGVNLTICSVTPSSNAIDYLAEFSGDDVDVLRNECNTCVLYYKKLVSAYKKEKSKNDLIAPGRLLIKLSNTAPVARSYIFDHSQKHGQISYTPYLRLKDSTTSPSLFFEKHHNVFSAFVESTLNLVEQADTYFDSLNDVE